MNTWFKVFQINHKSQVNRGSGRYRNGVSIPEPGIGVDEIFHVSDGRFAGIELIDQKKLAVSVAPDLVFAFRSDIDKMNTRFEVFHINHKSQVNRGSGRYSDLISVSEAGIGVDEIFHIRDGFFLNLQNINIKQAEEHCAPFSILVFSPHSGKVDAAT